MRYGLGRMPATDTRDRNFMMMSTVDQAAQEAEVDRWMRYHHAQGFWGDQGNQPHCVGFACVHLVEDGPVTHPESKPGTAIVDPSEVYREAQRLDEWPGEDYDGTSVRAGMKVLKQRGLISAYRWAWDLDTVVEALLHHGPVVMGTWWYDEMFRTDRNGFVWPRGGRAGGHAWVLNGVNKRTRTVRAKNSWGRGWGKKGYFYLTFETLARLIHEDGEACIAVELG